MSMSDWDNGLVIGSGVKKNSDIKTFIEKYPVGSSVFINKKYLSKGYSPKSLKELLHRGREVNLLMDSLKLMSTDLLG
jgi:hypothetical protein